MFFVMCPITANKDTYIHLKLGSSTFYFYLFTKLMITVLLSYFCWEMLRAGSSTHFEAKTKMTGEESAGNH